MFSDRVFQITLLISLITHSIILFQNTNLSIFSSDKKEQKLEISYVKSSEKIKDNVKNRIAVKKEKFIKLTSKIPTKEKTPPPFINKEGVFKNNKTPALRDLSFVKPSFIKPDIISIKKKITLPPVNLDKINNPSYISYYQIVREKIKRAAYQNYTRTEVGEIYLSFIICSDGYLKDIRLIEEKSSPSVYLREIALKSVKDASAFPNFPKDLDYPQLSFNVIISFEIE